MDFEPPIWRLMWLPMNQWGSCCSLMLSRRSDGADLLETLYPGASSWGSLPDYVIGYVTCPHIVSCVTLISMGRRRCCLCACCCRPSAPTSGLR